MQDKSTKEEKLRETETLVTGSVTAAETILGYVRPDLCSVPNLKVTARRENDKLPIVLDIDKDKDGKADGQAVVSYTESGQLDTIAVDNDYNGFRDLTVKAWRELGKPINLAFYSHSQFGKDARAEVQWSKEPARHVEKMYFLDPMSTQYVGVIEFHNDPNSLIPKAVSIDSNGDGVYDIKTKIGKKQT